MNLYVTSRFNKTNWDTDDFIVPLKNLLIFSKTMSYSFQNFSRAKKLACIFNVCAKSKINGTKNQFVKIGPAGEARQLTK